MFPLFRVAEAGISHRVTDPQDSPFAKFFHHNEHTPSRVLLPGLPNGFPHGNTGPMPPHPAGVDETQHRATPLPLPGSGNTGFIPPWMRHGGTGVHYPIPSRRHRLGIFNPWHLHAPIGIRLNDGFDFSVPDLTSGLPGTQANSGISSSGGWGDAIGSLLGTVVNAGSQYEIQRMKMNLMSKMYSPQNVQTMMQTYQGQAAVTGSQADAERMQRELEYERSMGTRSGNVMSTGLVVAGLAGLLVVLMMRKPKAEPKAA